MSKITVCDILREHGQAYILENGIKGQQKGIIKLLSACKTRGLGAHYRQCSACSHFDKAFNSCRNRHCPNCQQKDKEKWLDKRMEELLPIGYYHLVFTIPHELNRLCFKNKKIMFDILFKAASETILELTKDTKHLGADTGLITVLHTWGQSMTEHPHLHCIMPAGGLSFDKENWVHTTKSKDFFVHYKILSAKFKGKFLDLLKKEYYQGNLKLKGSLESLVKRKNFNTLLDALYKKKWVANIQKPFAHPQKVLEYLSRYVFRIAISDKRIEKVEDGMVHFTIKDYKRKGVFSKLKLTINEFIHRFLLHLLPKRFLKVRYYGIFANTHRKANIDKAKVLLDEEKANKKQEDIEDGIQTWEQTDTVWTQIMQQIKDRLKINCLACKKGQMQFAGLVKEPTLPIVESTG